MSEPARVLPTVEDDSETAPGPLRDWLAAMRRYESDEGTLPNGSSPTATPTPKAANTARGPRLVQAEPAAEREEAADISELMAENLMLKARLKVENDRQEALQSALAGQIRELREHIAQEMESLEELRAEQASVQAEYSEFRGERDHLRGERDRAMAERDALLAERDALREERDLWQARAEALAQPLFQSAKR
ncbi:ATPase [Methylobacterium sp. J-076]|uniref:ATPase n=1 Tax=Methylobacterium sp. J-076 TaxID=2836655 RepID=UPI001FB9C887|nr:ATPase [Methylobacterium sp. J-076]MCJ2014901.1 ATPase [Methylobacterium sp. J-076]